MDTTYNPKKVENKWYEHWLKKRYFHAEIEPGRGNYSIVIPPPNITGSLHLGHALNNTLQDILVRWKRMQGYNALWVPGTDHAGIATQARVEEYLKKEGNSRHQLGREKFLERVWQWKEQYGGEIINQLKHLGTSCDWDRERFTMDEGCSKAVQEVFCRLYEKGLIYRGDYIINWCPACHTTISDIEVEHKEEDGYLYYIRYPEKEEGLEIIVATTRPETMLGDTAVAVHPNDPRYRYLIGKKLTLPLVNREIPVIADDFVDSEFGTGAVKVTPAHDPNDFEMGMRHELPVIKVIDEKGYMTEDAFKYQGMEILQCREALVRELKKLGYLVKVEPYSHSVGHCYRCDTVIEPLVSKQWFVKMKPLAEPAIKAVEEDNIKFIPSRFTKVYLNWLYELRDWCISRQLWWGHRIPVWYCRECGEMQVSTEQLINCHHCGSENIYQDPDVLDTWFSSALWPFSTLGWPEFTGELREFYPTSVLVTGRDIIFFWVARMIFMGLEFMEDVPFHEVYIHGLVLDHLGRKMSKSLGNGVDPLEVIEEYGADALRFMLVTGNTPGNDLRFHFERLEASRNFANKIWNASRFAFLNLNDFVPEQQFENLDLSDRWILSRYQRTIEEVTRHLEKYEIGEAARILYDFTWNELCDWYIELVKPRLYGKMNEESRHTAQEVLYYVLEGALRLLHPFMPFVTEEIWQNLPHEGESIVIADWPEFNRNMLDTEAEKEMDFLMDVIKAVRNIRGELKVPPSKMIDTVLLVHSGAARTSLEKNRDYIINLAKVGDMEITVDRDRRPKNALSAVVHHIEVFVPLRGAELDREISRLEKELKGLENDLLKVNKKLNSQGFLAKAPAVIVDKERQKQEEYLSTKDKVQKRLDALKI